MPTRRHVQPLRSSHDNFGFNFCLMNKVYKTASFKVYKTNSANKASENGKIINIVLLSIHLIKDIFNYEGMLAVEDAEIIKKLFTFPSTGVATLRPLFFLISQNFLLLEINFI